MERVKGIEPSFSAWEADVLPLNYTRSLTIPTSLLRVSNKPNSLDRPSGAVHLDAARIRVGGPQSTDVQPEANTDTADWVPNLRQILCQNRLPAVSRDAGLPMYRHNPLKPLFLVASMLLASSATAGPVYQPPGANLTFGDVTHGQRVQSASTNPAAAAADLTRGREARTRGVVSSASVGLEYGNIQDLWDFYDEITRGYEPSDPGAGGGPGQNPGDKPGGGIDLGEIWDRVDPDVQDAIRALSDELARQVAIGAIIRAEGYGKAWIAVDLPFVTGTEYFGGAWTFGLNYSGSSKAFGIVDQIEFDADAAREALNDWLAQLPGNRPIQLPVSSDLQLYHDPATNGFGLGINNDSSLIAKSTRTTELSTGYSRLARSSESGDLFSRCSRPSSTTRNSAASAFASATSPTPKNYSIRFATEIFAATPASGWTSALCGSPTVTSSASR